MNITASLIKPRTLIRRYGIELELGYIDGDGHNRKLSILAFNLGRWTWELRFIGKPRSNPVFAPY